MCNCDKKSDELTLARDRAGPSSRSCPVANAMARVESLDKGSEKRGRMCTVSDLLERGRVLIISLIKKNRCHSHSWDLAMGFLIRCVSDYCVSCIVIEIEGLLFGTIVAAIFAEQGLTTCLS